MKSEQQIEYSSEYCVRPEFLTIENLFNGYQYYRTTEYILGITTNPQSWEKRRIYDYNNPIFKGTIGYENNFIYDSIVVYIKIGKKEYYSCNGLCEPKRSTQILDIYKNVKGLSGKEYFGQNDIERYMYSELLKLGSVTNHLIKS